jgi:two-component system NtrC family sensor kinase
VNAQSSDRVVDIARPAAERPNGLCGGDDVSVFRLEANKLLRVARYGSMKGPAGYAIPALRGTVVERSVLEHRPIHVVDLQLETDDYPDGSAIVRELGHRTILAVPLLRKGIPYGPITVRRNKLEPFSDKQIELVTTFADQAVIAIENTRLFEEVQERTRDLTEALETADGHGRCLEGYQPVRPRSAKGT